MSSTHKRQKTRSRSRYDAFDPLGLAALGGGGAGFFAFYIVAEIALAAQPHYWHWILAFGGAIGGYLIGLYVESR